MIRSGPPAPAGADRPDADLAARVHAWVADDPDPATACEAAELLAVSAGPGAAARVARTELAERFSGLLAFGTAGLRGALGAGPHRMNRAVVIRAAAALTDYLAAELVRRSPGSPGGPRVVVGYDARHGSAVFARDTAAVVTAAGGTALLLPETLPTPVLAFAVRRLDADAGVMVTASHNPAGDNGYKVYLGGRVATGAAQGAQLVPPADAEIAAGMAAIRAVRDVPRAAGGWCVLDDSVRAAYLARLALTVPAAERSLRVVLTPLHGVGGTTALAALRAAGFHDVHLVPEQAAPDPAFPTVPLPNPEEPGALDLALATARRVGADLVLALDPDADRCAVAVPQNGTSPGNAAGQGRPATTGHTPWRVLTGDEVGALLGEQAARAVERHRPDRAHPVLASSLVSCRLLARIAAAHGIEHRTTLTGFKWIARVPGLVFGYEEALGYCVDPDAVRDKDGIAAAVRVAALADSLARAGRSLASALDDLARAHGLHATTQVSLRVEEVTQVTATMSRLRARPPGTLGGSDVTVTQDLARGSADLPATDALAYRTASGGRVVVRPSGTEPKLKCYLEVVEPVADDDVARARARAAARLARLRADVAALVGA